MTINSQSPNTQHSISTRTQNSENANTGRLWSILWAVLNFAGNILSYIINACYKLSMLLGYRPSLLSDILSRDLKPWSPFNNDATKQVWDTISSPEKDRVLHMTGQLDKLLYMTAPLDEMRKDIEQEIDSVHSLCIELLSSLQMETEQEDLKDLFEQLKQSSPALQSPFEKLFLMSTDIDWKEKTQLENHVSQLVSRIIEKSPKCEAIANMINQNLSRLLSGLINIDVCEMLKQHINEKHAYINQKIALEKYPLDADKSPEYIAKQLNLTRHVAQKNSVCTQLEFLHDLAFEHLQQLSLVANPDNIKYYNQLHSRNPFYRRDHISQSFINAQQASWKINVYQDFTDGIVLYCNNNMTMSQDIETRFIDAMELYLTRTKKLQTHALYTHNANAIIRDLFVNMERANFLEDKPTKACEDRIRSIRKHIIDTLSTLYSDLFPFTKEDANKETSSTADLAASPEGDSKKEISSATDLATSPKEDTDKETSSAAELSSSSERGANNEEHMVLKTYTNIKEKMASQWQKVDTTKIESISTSWNPFLQLNETASLQHIENIKFDPNERSIDPLHNHINILYTDISRNLGEVYEQIENILQQLQYPEQQTFKDLWDDLISSRPEIDIQAKKLHLEFHNIIWREKTKLDDFMKSVVDTLDKPNPDHYMRKLTGTLECLTTMLSMIHTFNFYYNIFDITNKAMIETQSQPKGVSIAPSSSVDIVQQQTVSFEEYKDFVVERIFSTVEPCIKKHLSTKADCLYKMLYGLAIQIPLLSYRGMNNLGHDLAILDKSIFEINSSRLIELKALKFDTSNAPSDSDKAALKKTLSLPLMRAVSKAIYARLLLPAATPPLKPEHITELRSAYSWTAEDLYHLTKDHIDALLDAIQKDFETTDWSQITDFDLYANFLIATEKCANKLRAETLSGIENTLTSNILPENI